ncbi:MAG: insulinase family protein [Bosea sp.]|jgi:predicted Zn-dependent peptidase|nr:insulinase family protein [Bosea sp. (in: a-proteobacteria)]
MSAKLTLPAAAPGLIMPGDEGVTITTLPSGLRIVSERMNHASTVSLGVWISAGSRHEAAGQHGLAHLLEHMAFKGTARRSARQIAEEIEAVGGDINAATSIEYTCYTARTLEEDLTLAIDILADILLNSSFAAEELAREKGVILQELAAVEDTPDDLVYDLFLARGFAEQPLGRAILGTPETVQGFDADAIRAYLAGHYTAGRMVIAACGAVDHDRLVALASAAFAPLPAGLLAPAGASASDQAHRALYTGGEVRRVARTDQSHLVLGFRGQPFTGGEHHALQVLATVMGGGLSSRLFQEVRETRGLAYAIDAFHWAFTDAGVFGIGAGTAPKDIPELVRVCMHCLRDAGQSVSEAEVQRARAQMKVGLLGALETPGGRVEQLARQVLTFGRVIPRDEIAARIDAVTAQDVRAAALDVLASPPTLAMVGPKIKAADLKLADLTASGAH